MDILLYYINSIVWHPIVFPSSMIRQPCLIIHVRELAKPDSWKWSVPEMYSLEEGDHPG
jgi:hypothetical protein